MLTACSSGQSPQTQTPSKVAEQHAPVLVPDVLGVPLDEGKDSLERLGLVAQYEPRNCGPTDSCASNLVIGLVPEAGSSVSVGSTVTLIYYGA
ncbi:hypothetical protein NPS01_43520 [Nocardioides psychrotolerans]|nr:hypothetical protein NPS01_43520 [Nocardioides psychrotolerans]